MSEFLNINCNEYMATVPDKYFELAIVDPPYGSGGGDWELRNRSRFGGIFDKYKIERTGGTWSKKYQKDGKSIKHWDVAPDDEFFTELFRISKFQIIWGGNYFNLPISRNFIIWRKLTISEKFTMAMAEYAWTNIIGNAKIFSCAPQGTQNESRFHPTQKPIKLYQWLLQNYAKKGDKIFDSHVGSGSSIIACLEEGFEYVGCELDVDYYKAASERIETYKSQGKLNFGE